MQLLDGPPAIPWRFGAALAGVLGAAAVLTPRPAVRASAPAITVDAPAIPHGADVSVAADDAPPPESALDFQMVFQLGNATYVKIATLDSGALPHHGRLRTIHGDGVDAVVASASDAAVPVRDQIGATLILDGKCTAKVTGIAIVARVTGEPAYAGLEGEHWSTADILDKGNVLLAAKLDHCAGIYARPPGLPPVIVPEQIENRAAAAAAKAAVLASDAAAHTQQEWRDSGRTGSWTTEATWTTQVLRHPRTGTTWVAIHAHHDWGCGDAEVNVWGLFRVEADGTLTKLELRVHELDQIDQLVDLGGDGQLEVIGRPWLGTDLVIERASGEELDRLTLPFFGCPC